jgi:tetratricopeptide (TPR) repeat protein
MKTYYFVYRTLVSLLVLSCTVLLAVDFEKEGKVPITAASKSALDNFLQGRDLQERLQAQEAIQYFEKAVSADPNFAMGYLYLSLVAPTNKVFFENVEKAKQKVESVSEGEKLWILGFDAGVNGFTMKQRDFYTKLVTLFPQDERAQNLLGAHYFGQQDYEEAIKYYKKAIEINPAFSTPYNQLGYAQRFLENYDEAEKAFKKYIELIPNDPNPYDSYAELLMKIGKYEESIKSYKKALTYNPNFVASYIGIATNLNYLGKHQESRQQLKKLYKIARNDGERRAAHFAMAVSFTDEGKMKDALKELDKQYTLAQKTNDASAMAGDYIAMGNIYLEMGEAEQALKSYQKAINFIKDSDLTKEVKDNFHRGYLYNATRVFVKLDDLAQAKDTAQKHRKLVEQIQNPFQIRLSHELYGMISLAEKDYVNAIEELQKSNLQNPYNLYRLALAYQGKNDQTKAEEFTKRAKQYNALNNLNYAFVRSLIK